MTSSTFQAEAGSRTKQAQDQIAAALEHCPQLQNIITPGIGSVHGRIFNRPDRRDPPFRNQKIRKRRMPNQPLPLPLFGGFLRIQGVSESDRAWKLSSILTVNPTRFLRYQTLPSRQVLFSSGPPTFTYRLFQADLEHDYDDEFALDEKLEINNWLPQSGAWRLYSGIRFWPIHLRQYLTRVVAAVRQDISRAANHATILIASGAQNPIALYSVETYWEFFSEHSSDTVRSMKPLLESYCAAPVSEQDYTVQRPEANVVLNSHVLTVPIQNGQILKIYSKTNQRIRFEVTHIFNGDKPFRLPVGLVRSFSSAEAMVPLLTHLATLSANRVNEVFRHFCQSASTPGEQRPVLAFLADFQSVVGDYEKASQLLQMLIPNGGIIVGPGIEIGGRFRPELQRLVRQGILRTSNYKYTVMPRYISALRYLQARGIDSLLLIFSI
jgi:hypothetical protein